MTTTHRGRPDASEFAPFYAGYVAEVPDGEILEVIRRGATDFATTLATIPEARGDHRYADGKWSIRELLGHIIDTERVFSYRTLRIARGDATPLPGFDQDPYVLTSGAQQRTIGSLAAELAAVRASTIALLDSLPDEAWTRVGTASGHPVSARAMAYITAGHAEHHLEILRSRYLVR